MAAGPHISLSAETLFTVSGLEITNSIFTSTILAALIILFAFAVKIKFSKPNLKKPSGFQNIVEMIVESLYNLVYSVTEDHAKAKVFFPFIGSFFIFIIINNWSGLIPGVGTIGLVRQPEEVAIIKPELIKQAKAEEVAVEETTGAAPEAALSNLEAETTGHMEAEKTTGEAMEEHAETEEEHAEFVPFFRAGTADLNTTLALALFSVFMIQYFGVKYLSLGYFKKFINFSGFIPFIVGILEIISEVAKIVSFAFRLFGNIFAGEVLLAVLAYIGGTWGFFIPLPFYGLELFVGLIQALVFAMLSLVFFNMATISHDEH